MSKENDTNAGAQAVANTAMLDLDLFEVIDKDDDNKMKILRLGGVSCITILDRLTGWGCGDVRDVETGYKDHDGKFWLASGNFDVTKQGCVTVDNAITLIKANANTCVPV